MTETFPKAAGYLTVDSKKCAGCGSCMLACSVAHEGVENLTLSRIQVVQNVFGTYPKDIRAVACRQCAKPLCAEACPTGACYVDTANGNIRVIDDSKCDGCGHCREACPFVPRMIIWHEGKAVTMKCDLCLNAPYWSETGGPNGKQACVEICPMGAISLTGNASEDAEDDVTLTKGAR
jgi:protein NrfC